MVDTVIALPSSALGRLSLMGDILDIHSGIKHAESKDNLKKARYAKTLGQRRLNALRRVLMGRQGGDVTDEFMSPTVGPKKLAAMLDGLALKPPLERLKDSLYISKIAGMLQTILMTELNNGSLVKFDDQAIVAVYRRAEAMQKEHGKPDDLIDDHVANGNFGEKVKKAAQDAKAANGGTTKIGGEFRPYDADPELVKLINAAYDDASNLATTARQLNAVFYTASKNREKAASQGLGIEKLKEINDAYLIAEKAQIDAFNLAMQKASEANALNTKLSQAVRDAQNKKAEIFAEAGRQAIADVLGASPISMDEAVKWANEQEITKATLTRLKILKYPIADVRRDMADYYRLVGGRIIKIKIDSKGDRRANASEIESHGKGGVIYLGSAFDKATLWHELAHHLEDDPTAKAASSYFINRRSEDKKSYSLKSLTGNVGYGKREVAYKDHFFHEYVGKIYADGVTEVFSMGVESFSDPVTLGKRIADDPQTLEFVAGYLKQPINPLAKVMQSLRETMVQIADEANSGTVDVVAELVAELAKTVQIKPSSDLSWLKEDRAWFASSRIKNPVAVGYVELAGETVWILTGTVKNPETLRAVKGYLFCTISPHRISSTAFVGTIDQLKAGIAVYGKTGRPPILSNLDNETDLRRALSQ